MTDSIHPIIRLLQEDRRYKLDAYQFVRDALAFAQENRHTLGASETKPKRKRKEPEPDEASEDETSPKPEKKGKQRHLTGRELCQAIRIFAVRQYGLLAKTVLNSWGLHTTSDFGDVVYNMIRVEMMRKSKSDRREDFNDCYDFQEAFVTDFRIEQGEG